MSRVKIASTPSRPSRDHNLDVWRGLAVVGLLVDHLLAALAIWHLAGGGSLGQDLVRLTLTRLVMPTFMIVSGALLARRAASRRRLLEVACAALVVNLLAAALPIGLGTPDILVLWLGWALLRRLWVNQPVAALVLGAIQASIWPVAWAGYQPGWVLMFLCVGVLAERGRALPCAELPRRLGLILATLGRSPLRWYVGEVIALSALAIFLTRVGLR